MAEKREKSQPSWLLFMHSAWTVAASPSNACTKKKKKYQTQNSSFPSNPNIALKPNAKINREWREPKIYGLLITHLQLATCNLQHMLFILFKVYNVKQFSFWRMMLVFIHHIYNTSRSLSCILFLGGEKKRVKIKKDDKK